MNKAQKNFVFTLFGASGDLAKLKIYPSLYELFVKGEISGEFWIIGYARSLKEREIHQAEVREAILESSEGKMGDDTKLNAFLSKVYAFKGQYDQKESFDGYKSFRDGITGGKYDEEIGYLSVPPKIFAPIIANFAEEEKAKAEKQKIVLEKPFGENQSTAKELYGHLQKHFDDEQMFLLDHYLGKGPVRSILGLRHNNKLLNSMLKGNEIRQIEINALESLGVEERLGYFDQVGTLKDMIQSHLLQILSLITMSIPISMDPKSIRREKAAILSALSFEPLEENVCFGQYEGYCEGGEGKTSCNPYTPTFTALKLHINRESWDGVSILLRSGKFLPKKQSYITVELKKFSFQGEDFPPNRIIIEMSPEERLHLKLFDGNSEGSGASALPSLLSGQHNIACHGKCLGQHATLIADVIQNNQTHFLSFEEILSCWKIVDQVVEFMHMKKPETYARGSKGPVGQEKLGNFYPLDNEQSK